ncbi:MULTISPECIES: AMP-binding protein [Rhodococcus]|uniref:AMP-binding protein n=1 Tax=Rhodococcus oxybenzonivorans TaxID=1990687 RepID=A0AAE5A5G4_9NOCA|nr:MULTISPECIES: AMP-binding protein [Rhodococcus]MDV7243367.1 AMP-binding protein [Rhodococcus oxybenzonivorans]MDV7263933.1 AMP-binding protein [Rhodococcus oxybenzonivorans]MDV7276793.1 AMP-binding protein [Rhodococcus oxybenzonivorans]MDV7334373.1 AMP-binding protein [Rhodococcus oxybenzonivorans]MDV7344528.1 AMP-binding protein [Rhodococcus oxybenzonivorans]
MTYRDEYKLSTTDPTAFWSQAARAIEWDRPAAVTLDERNAPLYRWFPDGILNTCFNALDRHVQAGHGARQALIYDSPVTGSKRSFTYAKLTALTAKFAGVLRHLGVRQGDRVLLYMPMIPEAVIAMLACARLGAVHSVVFGGFAAPELAARIDDAEPVVIVSASCGIEPTRIVEYKPLLDAALDLADHAPARCVVVQRPQYEASMTSRDVDYTEMMESRIEPANCVPVAGTDPLYILYTSGTTGRPKGVVRDNGGHAVALAWSMANVYDIGPGDAMFTASDVGWVVGHSYIVYGPLLVGATTVLYEGKPVGTPDAGAFWRIVEEHRVAAVFTAPTAIRALKRSDPRGEHFQRYDTSSLKNLFLAGERLDPDTYEWATTTFDVDVTDHWWQTETGWPIASNPRGLEPLPNKPGSAAVPLPGYVVHILDDVGYRLAADEEGAICLRLPLPPGALTGLWGDDTRYIDGYLSKYPGYYLTGDGGYVDEDGYLFVLGRTDDVMNVAGHRLSSGQIEAAIASHPAVAECAVIGERDALKGQVPRALVVTKIGHDSSGLEEELSHVVRTKVGPIASLSRVDVVGGLPKTRSGKILRRTLRQLVDGEPASIPSTIEDPSVLDELAPILTDRSPRESASPDLGVVRP